MPSNAKSIMETYESEKWRRLLEQAIKGAGRGGITIVANRLGVSRPYVSRVMSGDIYPVPPAFIVRVMNRYHVIPCCPATGKEQARNECERLSLSQAPTHNPQSMRLWRTCQSCPHKPQGETK